MAHGRIGLHDLRVTPFRPLPSRLTRPFSFLLVLAWIVQMGLLVRQAYFGAPVALAADLARYGSSAQWRGGSRHSAQNRAPRRLAAAPADGHGAVCDGVGLRR